MERDHWPPDFWTLNERLQFRHISRSLPRDAVKARFLALHQDVLGCAPSRRYYRDARRYDPLDTQELQCAHEHVEILDAAIDAFLPESYLLAKRKGF